MKCKAIICIVSTISFFFSLYTTTAQPPGTGLKIVHLTGDFYIYTSYHSYNGSPFPSNSMYLVTDSGVVMFDTPWDSTQFQPLLDSIRIKHHKKVVLCIATHFHEDRTGGFAFLRQKGIKTYTTLQTDELSKARGDKRAEFLMEKDSAFSIGQHRFQTYYGGEGHSPDNIVIWFPKERILYGGCLIKSTEASDLGNLADANVKQWGNTLRNIQEHFKKPAYIIPGHQDWSSTESLQHTLELVRQYEENNKR